MDTDEQRATSAGSVAFTLLLWLLAGYIFNGAFEFSYPANVAPLALGGVAFALVTGVLVRELLAFLRARGEKGDPAAAKPGRAGDAVPVASALAVTALVIVLGYLAGMSIALIALVRVYARERWVTTLVLTSCVMLVLYVAFGVMLDVGFYPSLLGLGS